MTTPSFLTLCQNDYKTVIKGIKKFAKDIFDGNDEDQKKDLIENLLDLVKQSVIPKPTKTLKRSIEVKHEPIAQNVIKKLKTDHGQKVQVPYDIWLKIMNYLDTKNLFNNFGLASQNKKNG